MESRETAVMVLMGSIHFVYHLFMRLIPPLIPILTLELGFPLWQLGLFLSVFFVGSSIGLIPMGILSDAYDRRMILSASLAVVGIGYLLFGSAPQFGATLPALHAGGYSVSGTYAGMLVGMLIAGLGTSAHVPVGIPLITSNISPEHKGRVLGIWGAGSKFGDAVTPAIVGLLILTYNWTQIVSFFSVFCILLAVLLFVILGDDRFDTAPVKSEADGTAADEAWTLLGNHQYLYPILALVGYFGAYQVVVQGVVTFVPTFITDIYGYSLTVGTVHIAPESFADLVLSVLLISAALSRIAGGILVDRFEHRAVLFFSLVGATVTLAIVSHFVLSPFLLVAMLAVFGSMLWGNSPARDSLISDLTPASREGRTFSYLFTASRAFGATAPVLIGFITDVSGIRIGFQYLAVSTGIAALFVALLFSDRVYRTG